MLTLRLAFFVFLPSLCLGQGFLYDAFDARSLGMGAAPFASGVGASALVFNPASAASRQGLFMNVGGALNMRQTDFSGQTTAGTDGSPSTSVASSTNNPVGALPQIGFAYGPSQFPFGFGISVTEPFQSTTAWPSNWTGGSTVDLFDVHAIYTSLAMGFRVNRFLTVGGGVHIVTGGFTMQNVGAQFSYISKTNIIDQSLEVTRSTDQVFDAAGTSAAVSASIIIAPAPQFSFAAGYTSGANIPVKGTLQNLGFASTDPYRQEAFNSSLAMPSVLTFGMDIHPTNAMRVDFMVEFIGWGGFTPFVISYSDSSVPTQNIGPTYKNATALRLGFEYLLSRSLALRAGVGYATSVLPDAGAAPFYSDAGAFLYSVGLGYQFTKNIRFDLAYRGAAYGKVTGTPTPQYSGTFAPSQDILAASIALAFEPTANPLSSPAQKK